MAEKIKDAVDCRQCQSPMEIIKAKKYAGTWPIVLIILGVFCSLFLIGALIGILMLLLGIYMATAKETISICPNCGHYFKMWVKDKS